MKHIRTKHLPASALDFGWHPFSITTKPGRTAGSAKHRILPPVADLLFDRGHPSCRGIPKHSASTPEHAGCYLLPKRPTLPTRTRTPRRLITSCISIRCGSTYQQFQVNNQLGATNSMVAPSASESGLQICCGQQLRHALLQCLSRPDGRAGRGHRAAGASGLLHSGSGLLRQRDSSLNSFARARRLCFHRSWIFRIASCRA